VKSALTSFSVAAGRLRASALCPVVVVAALALGGCGDLDDITTVKDLRVLAVKSEPPGFLVPLDHPEMLTNTTATLTALVVDPKKPLDILTLTGEACPDYVDTITAASGQSSKLCPSRAVTDQFPSPYDQDLATTQLPPGTTVPMLNSAIEYDPQVVYGLTPGQLTDFFTTSAQSAMFQPINQAILYNRDFSMDAIVSLTFTIGDETASALKRVVYWPLLPPELVPAGTDCPATQVANTNPVLTDVGLFRHRVDGIPTDPWNDGTMPTLTIGTDELYVQPAFDATAAEHYLLRVKNAETGLIETQCRKELLTFQFFASAGSFSPEERTSELSPVFMTPDNGHIPIDSQYHMPKTADIPADGSVTVWIVVRDERAGVGWMSRTFALTPALTP
jgi:hypothetical protein